RILALIQEKNHAQNLLLPGLGTSPVVSRLDFETDTHGVSRCPGTPDLAINCGISLCWRPATSVSPRFSHSRGLCDRPDRLLSRPGPPGRRQPEMTKPANRRR